MNEASDLLSVILSINGKVNDASIKRIEVFKSVNRISRGIVTLQDGIKEKQSFELSDSSDFTPGNKIEIKAGYNSKEKTIFKGVIIGQAISMDDQEGALLTLECNDEAIETSIVRNNSYFLNSSDSDIINRILSNYKLTKSVDSTKVMHQEVIQYGTTDWDFIISRAEMNGLVVVTDDGQFNVKKPAINDTPVADLKYGDNILRLDLAVTSGEQLLEVEATSWDASNQKIIKGKSQEPSVNKEGNITGEKLAEVLSATDLLQSSVPLEKEALEAWANAQLLKSRLSRFQGTILCDGSSKIKPNTLVKIDGVGEKMNGNCYVSSVTHALEEGLWSTEMRIGLQKEWYVENVPINALKASGRIPAMSGLHIGKVKKIDEDPSGEFRVQVILPLIQSSDEGVWARLSTQYASNGFGNFFYPEIGDEVILGFLDDNPSAPIILGSVYSKTNAPKRIPDQKNTYKAIDTKSGMSINFDDESKIISIETPGGRIISLSDKDKGIKITDQNNNSIELNDTGIMMDSHKDILIKAANNICLTGLKIDLKASYDLNMTGLNTTTKGSMSYVAEGGESAELKSSGNVTVKGAMIAIN